MRTYDIKNIENFAKLPLENDSSGHDWWHVHRVRNLALHIAKKENADENYTELLALLHETSDYKLVNNENESIKKLKDFLESQKINNVTIERLIKEIPEISYKGAGISDITSSKECNIVRDADRLDAIGAIGIARTFAYGGKHERQLYDPEIKPVIHDNFDKYKNNNSPTINHFYEKLLLLKDRLNTETAKEIAEKRQSVMLNFLDNFMDEWNLSVNEH